MVRILRQEDGDNFEFILHCTVKPCVGGKMAREVSETSFKISSLGGAWELRVMVLIVGDLPCKSGVVWGHGMGCVLSSSSSNVWRH